MKKNLIALAVLGATIAPVTAHAEAPTVYGSLHLSYGATETKSAGVVTVDNWQMQSHDSRLGFKGSREFKSGLTGIYKAEFGINPDSDLVDSGDGTAGIVRRNMYIGIKGGFGEFRFGRHDTPLKMAQGKFDLFGDTSGDLKNAGDEDGENRIDNVVAYIGGTDNLKVAVAIAPGEDTGTGSTVDDGPADTVSASVTYTAGPLYVAVARDSYENGENQQEDSLTRAVATYKMGDMQFGLLYQTGVEAADSTSAKEDWLGVSFKTRVSANNTFKVQYIAVEDSATQPKEGTLLALGLDHQLDKKTKAYVMYTRLDEDDTSGTSGDLESSFVGVGMNYKF
ncbi:MAG: porin [Gammaproteobacteria bacterium]|nr:porin [Gammaproteobacteria bacterium]